jgi:hypothetical protein
MGYWPADVESCAHRTHLGYGCQKATGLERKTRSSVHRSPFRPREGGDREYAYVYVYAYAVCSIRGSSAVAMLVPVVQ